MKFRFWSFIKSCWYKSFLGKKSLDKRFMKHVINNPMHEIYAKVEEERNELRDLWMAAKTIKDYNYDAPTYVMHKKLHCDGCKDGGNNKQCKYNKYLPCILNTKGIVDKEELNKDIIDLFNRYNLCVKK